MMVVYYKFQKAIKPMRILSDGIIGLSYTGSTVFSVQQ